MRDISVTLPEAQWIQIMRFLKQDLAAVRTMHSHDPVEEQKLRTTEYELQELIQLLDEQLSV